MRDQADKAVGKVLRIADLVGRAINIQRVKDIILGRQEVHPGKHVKTRHKLEGVLRGWGAREKYQAQIASGHDHVIDAAGVSIFGRRVDDCPKEIMGLINNEQLAVKAARRASKVATFYRFCTRPRTRHLVGGIVCVH